jgi:uncharacterized Zn finger protein
MVADLLSDAALIHASSPKIFERGNTYAASGAVSVRGEEGDPRAAIHAEVAGTQTYTTSVWIEGGDVAGSCDCPNGAGGWFCKHQVAVALIWRNRLSGVETIVDEAARKKVQASAKRARTIKSQRGALQEFLSLQPATTLAEKLIDLADNYHEIERELQQWQKLSQTQPQDLKPLVSEILRIGQRFLSLPEAYAYIRRAAAVLPVLQGARERDAEFAVALSLHALRRSWVAIMHADDSNGEIGDLVRAIAAEWVAALQGAGAQPAAFGDTYLRVQLEDPFGCFDQQAAEEAMGIAALNRYRSALAEQWRQAKDAVLAKRARRAGAFAARKPGAADWLQRDESEMRLWTLEHLHLAQLERVGDVDGAISVLREDLSEPSRFRAVTRFLEKHNRLREAFANAERSCKAFPEDWCLQDDLLRCYERDGWTTEAYALRRRQFEAEPSVERYHATLNAGVAAKEDGPALREALLRALEAREIKEMREDKPAPLTFSRGASRRRARDVSLRAQILCSERNWHEACVLVQPPAVCNANVLRQIALHLDEGHREESVALLLRVFAQAMRTASTPYREELRLVTEITQRLDAARRAAWLANLRSDFKAKRNFVRDLPKS